MKEECIFFISRDINKLLDMFAKNNQTTIPEGGGRERVFQRARSYCGLSLDVRGAHAFTHHMILNSPYFQKKWIFFWLQQIWMSEISVFALL